MKESKSCTCGESHVSKRVVHCYDGKPCYVVDEQQSKTPETDAAEKKWEDYCTWLNDQVCTSEYDQH